jgi:hypothetical protein
MTSMTILRMIDVTSELALTPEEKSSILAAYESVLLGLGITERDEVLSALLAKKVIAAAMTGERDPHRCATSLLSRWVMNSRLKGCQKRGRVCTHTTDTVDLDCISLELD